MTAPLQFVFFGLSYLLSKGQQTVAPQNALILMRFTFLSYSRQKITFLLLVFIILMRTLGELLRKTDSQLAL